MATNKTTQQNRSTHRNRTRHETRSSHQPNSREEPFMTEQTKPVSELFEQAMTSYEQAFKTGLKLQEESGKWLTSILEQNAPSREWQKTVRSMATEFLPQAQRRMEDGLRMVEQNSRANLEFLK